MRRSLSTHLTLGAALAAGILLTTLGTEAPTATTPAAGGTTAVQTAPSTTRDDQVDLALTVYNSNIALIRDTREISLPDGIFDLS